MRAEELEALAEMSMVGARAFFSGMPWSIARMDSVRCQLEEDIDSLPSGGSGRIGAGVSKPTEAKALWLVCDAPMVRQKLEAELGQLERTVGYGLVLCQFVRDGLGRKYGDAIERKYIDCVPWSQVADELSVSASHAKRLGGIAIDWLDMKSDEAHFRLRDLDEKGQPWPST